MKNFNSLQAQFNIRNNTMEMQDYLKDLHSWESDVKKKDKELRKGRGRGEPGGGGAPPGPRGRAASHAAVAPAPAHLQAPAAQLAKPGSAAAALNAKPRKKKSVAGVTKHAAAHTYEHYKDKVRHKECYNKPCGDYVVSAVTMVDDETRGRGQ